MTFGLITPAATMVRPIPQFIGSNVGDGTTRAIPAHEAGDLILGIAYREGNSGAITVPAGWTALSPVVGTFYGVRIQAAWKIAASDAEVSETWTRATSLCMMVYRNASQIGAVVDHVAAVGGGTAGFTDFQSMGLQSPTSSVVIFCSNHATTGNEASGTCPGFTMRNYFTTNKRLWIQDSGGPYGLKTLPGALVPQSVNFAEQIQQYEILG